MTEKEACLRWCPFARVAADGVHVTFNRGVNDDLEPVLSSAARCVASECMAWHTEFTDVRGFKHGFCALIGKPPSGKLP